MTHLHQQHELGIHRWLDFDESYFSQSKSSVHIYTMFIPWPLRQVAMRLCEFATVRAMECHAVATAAAASNSGGGSAAVLGVAMLAGQGVESCRPCKLRLRTEQVVVYFYLCAKMMAHMITCHRILNLKSEFWSDSFFFIFWFVLLGLHIPKM